MEGNPWPSDFWLRPALGVAKVTSTRPTQAYTRLAGNDLREGKVRMNTISLLSNLLHPTNEGQPLFGFGSHCCYPGRQRMSCHRIVSNLG